MSEVLVSSKEFSAHELGRRLFDLYHTGQTAEILAQRHINGFGARYGQSVYMAIEHVKKGQAAVDPAHYVVVAKDGNIYGTASIYYDLPLRRSRLPLPGAIARRAAKKKIPTGLTSYPNAKPNIQAAVVDGQEELLFPAYAALADMTRPSNDNQGIYSRLRPRPWTIEANSFWYKPSPAQQVAHEAIAAAELIEVTSGWFDDGETSRELLPYSTLYILPDPLQSEMTPGEILGELSTGDPASYRALDKKMNDRFGRSQLGP